jgi:hypothetical protein
LTAAFRSNDFDAFELRTGREASPYGIHVLGEIMLPSFCWRKSEHPGLAESGLEFEAEPLNLVTAANQRCGELAIFPSLCQSRFAA